jgi:outer membrane protein OmpA-like peptidoglycan-associated protein
MKTKIESSGKSRIVRYLDRLATKKAALLALLFFSMLAPVSAQETAPQYSVPSWWFGVAGAGNINFFRGSTQRLDDNLIAPVAFHNGTGLGLYVAPVVEYHKATSMWGITLQGGYDSRRGTYKQMFSPCNCPRDLSTKLSYWTLEPTVRFSPMKTGLYIFAGPRFAVNYQKSFKYEQGINPAHPEQVAPDPINGDLSFINKMMVSGQVGVGYDIPISDQTRQTQLVLSPFVSFQPYFGQAPRSIESWSMTTVRIGAALKIGRGKLIPAVVVEPEYVPEANTPEVFFTVNAPSNIPVERKVKEVFPLRNYVFFDLGSTEIPNRYVMLEKNQVADFKEDQVQLYTPKNLSGRSNRQMVVYYNVLNILGDRMSKNPSTTVNLVGSTEEGSADGKTMAESVKNYLVTTFGIAPTRITTEGRSRPEIASSKTGAPQDLELLRAGERRVSIESSSPLLLQEFQSGPNASLRPVEIIGVQVAPIESYVAFTADGSREAFSYWSLEIKDEKGVTQNFGPYYQETVRIPGKSILGTRPSGNFNVKMIGTTSNGGIVTKETKVKMTLWTPPVNQEVMRYSVLFEFDESKTIAMYEKYLDEVVVPKVPNGATIIIHGYTDIIGDETYNQNLSVARANEVKDILNGGLTKAGRTDVKFEMYGFGEDENLSQFDNKYPEERFYNRTVIIDIVPAK